MDSGGSLIETPKNLKGIFHVVKYFHRQETLVAPTQLDNAFMDLSVSAFGVWNEARLPDVILCHFHLLNLRRRQYYLRYKEKIYLHELLSVTA